MNKSLYILVVVFAIAISNFLHSAEDMKKPCIWVVEPIQLPKNLRYMKALKEALNKKFGKDGYELHSKLTLAQPGRLKNIFAAANRKDADILLMLNPVEALLASREVTAIPVFYSCSCYPDAYGLLNNSGLGIKAPVDMITALLVSSGWKTKKILVVMNDKDARCDAEYAALKSAFKKQGMSKPSPIAIDAKTCARLMDMVSAYNFLDRINPDALYFVEDGNVLKNSGLLRRLAHKKGILVLGGSKESVINGAAFAFAPDMDAVANASVETVLNALAGKPLTKSMLDVFVFYYNPEQCKKHGVVIPEGIKSIAIKAK